MHFSAFIVAALATGAPLAFAHDHHHGSGAIRPTGYPTGGYPHPSGGFAHPSGKRPHRTRKSKTKTATTTEEGVPTSTLTVEERSNVAHWNQLAARQADSSDEASVAGSFTGRFPMPTGTGFAGPSGGYAKPSGKPCSDDDVFKGKGKAHSTGGRRPRPTGFPRPSGRPHHSFETKTMRPTATTQSESVATFI
ncbi:hypothetical protein BJ875DRAFT_101852 [Amylocarpus encephaloides]|uniref:Uncharacterized protein n=1 Tax=Amylocarpus encephaloides TaxID=45428 RepID=A0A9P7YRQ3_9HELO|nr:hypothetical protein BJ875DRAFT_101852 [Amylocarpus encephaloides]